MNRARLIASTPSPDDTSPAGIVATAMRYLAHAAPTAYGITCISPDGTVRYISRQEAERFVFGPDAGEVRQ